MLCFGGKSLSGVTNGRHVSRGSLRAVGTIYKDERLSDNGGKRGEGVGSGDYQGSCRYDVCAPCLINHPSSRHSGSSGERGADVNTGDNYGNSRCVG